MGPIAEYPLAPHAGEATYAAIAKNNNLELAPQVIIRIIKLNARRGVLSVWADTPWLSAHYLAGPL